MKAEYLDKLARIISTIFIPPTLTVLSFIFIALEFETDPNKKYFTILISFLFGFILQIGMFVYFFRKGMISDVDAKQKYQRTIPYYISVTIFIIGFILLLIGRVSIVSIAFWFCYISNTFLVILINRYLKISIHAMGCSGPLALLTFLIGINALLFLPIIFAVGWSRIRLKVHSLIEVTIGAIFGFVSVYFQLFLLLSKF